MRKIFAVAVLLLALLAARAGWANSLNAQVTITTENVVITDGTLVQKMQNDMVAFLNTTPWNQQSYRVEGNIDERINVRMFIGITAIPQNGTYQATMRLVATRPVYGTGYKTNLLSINDRNFNFNYVPGIQLAYSPSNFANNLTSLLSFYAYWVMGTDQDTFSRLGGSIYYDQARIILQYSANQSTTNESDTGWTDASPRNRYWLLNNLTDPQLEAFRTSLYAYYRQGMDIFIEKPTDARVSILSALSGIQKANVVRPGTLFVRAFFDAKADEITNVFRTGTDEQKRTLVTMLTDADPDNLAKYQTLVNR